MAKVTTRAPNHVGLQLFTVVFSQSVYCYDYLINYMSSAGIY